MPYALLDDNFYSNPKVVAAGLEAAGLYARALSYAAKHLTDGFVPAGWATETAAGKRAVIKRLVSNGLWDEAEAGYTIHDYLKFNPSKAKVLERRAERSKSGRKGAEARWHSGSSNGSSDTNSHSSSHSDMHGNTDSYAMPQLTQYPVKAFTQSSTRVDGPKLPEEKERLIERLLGNVRSFDDDTPNVWRSYACKLPLAVLARVDETVSGKPKAYGAGYVTRALQGAVNDLGRSAA